MRRVRWKGEGVLAQLKEWPNLRHAQVGMSEVEGLNDRTVINHRIDLVRHQRSGRAIKPIEATRVEPSTRAVLVCHRAARDSDHFAVQTVDAGNAVPHLAQRHHAGKARGHIRDDAYAAHHPDRAENLAVPHCLCGEPRLATEGEGHTAQQCLGKGVVIFRREFAVDFAPEEQQRNGNDDQGQRADAQSFDVSIVDQASPQRRE